MSKRLGDLMAERRAFFALFASLIGAAWWALWLWGRSPYSRYLNHQQLVDLASGSLVLPITLYLGGWLLMTVAMMLPTTLPLLEYFRRLTADRQDRAGLLALVIAGYLGVWLAFGILAHGADWALHELVEHRSWLEAQARFIGAFVLLAAGAFQFSRLKYRCLDKCRSPLSFVTEHWRGSAEKWNAFSLGAHHGVFCVGCCWALMLLMFAVGTGNLAWMLLLGAIMAAEKNLPWGHKLSTPVGIALLACGGVSLLTKF